MGGHLKTRVDEQGRVCTMCGQYHVWDAFGRDLGAATGHKSHCRACDAAQARAYRRQVGTAVRRKSRLYRQAHREEVRAAQRARYQARVAQERARGHKRRERATARARSVLVPLLLDLVAAYWGLDRDELTGPARDAASVEARWAAMLLLRNHLKMTHNAIARATGRDHSSVLHGLRAARRRMYSTRRGDRFPAMVANVRRDFYALRAARMDLPKALRGRHKPERVTVPHADPVTLYFRRQAETQERNRQVVYAVG